MRIQSWRALAVAAVLVSVASCGGSSGSSEPTLSTDPAASGMAVERDGFTFANFGSAATSEEMNADDIVAMFGSSDKVCVGGVVPCTLTAEAAAWARMVNDARASGHCEGLAVVASSRFVEKAAPQTSEIAMDPKVVHSIIRGFATQFLPDALSETEDWAKKSLKAKVAALAESFKSGKTEYTMGVYSDIGGHAILPYAVDFPNPDTAIIKIYDSNWPSAERFVTVDLKSNTWTFPFKGQDPANDPDAWTGGSKDLDLTSMTSRESSKCPFCNDETVVQRNMFVIHSSLPTWSIDTGDETITPDTSDSENWEVRPLRLETSPTVFAYTVTSRVENQSILEAKLSLPNEARVNIIRPDSIVNIGTNAKGTKKQILVTDDSVSVDDPAVLVTVASDNAVVTAAGGLNTVTAGEGVVSANFMSATGDDVAVETTTDESAIDARSGGATGVASGVSYQVSTATTDGTIERTVVARDGNTTTSKIQGVLDNQKTTNQLPATLGGAVTTVATNNSRPVATTTTVATANTTRTTVAGGTISITEVSVGMDVTQWGPGLNDPGGQGFNAVLTLTRGSTPNKFSCADIACLEGVATTIMPTSVDATTGRTVTTSLTFAMNNVAVPFSVRCGAKGTWVAATAAGAVYNASCSLSSVTNDEAVYVKTT